MKKSEGVLPSMCYTPSPDYIPVYGGRFTPDESGGGFFRYMAPAEGQPFDPGKTNRGFTFYKQAHRACREETCTRSEGHDGLHRSYETGAEWTSVGY
jgi:hypothetical protein